MVLVSHIFKFIYIKNRKVAGTSVEAFFEKYCIKPDKKYKAEHQSEQRVSEYGIIGCRMVSIPKEHLWYNHITASEIKKILGSDKFNRYFKFSVVRNPYDKIVSLFHFFANKVDNDLKKNFKNFCINYDCNDMNSICIDGKPICDMYIRYENLENDIIQVCKKLGIKDYDIKELPKFKSGIRDKSKSYREYYDDETKMIVYKKHENEIKYFGYDF